MPEMGMAFQSKVRITEDEKCTLRPLIMQFFGSHSKVLNNSHALIVAKIARYDYPTYWPQLIDQLLDVVRSSFATGVLVFQIHCLYTLHLVIKTLASKTLPSSRVEFINVAPKVFEFLIRIFDEFLKSFFSTAGNEEEASRNLEIVLMCLKSCRRLLVYGFSDIAQNATALEFYKRLLVLNQEMIKSSMFIVSYDRKPFRAALSKGGQDYYSCWKNILGFAGKRFGTIYIYSRTFEHCVIVLENSSRFHSRYLPL